MINKIIHRPLWAYNEEIRITELLDDGEIGEEEYAELKRELKHAEEDYADSSM